MHIPFIIKLVIFLMVSFLIIILIINSNKYDNSPEKFSLSEEAKSNLGEFRQFDWKGKGEYALTHSKSNLLLTSDYIVLVGKEAQKAQEIENIFSTGIREAFVSRANGNNGGMWFTYHNSGHILLDDWTYLNISSIIKEFSEKDGFNDAKWIYTPTIDRHSKAIYWAIKIKNNNDFDIVHSIVLKFSRTGYMRIECISNEFLFKQELAFMLNAHNFEPGFGYEDYSYGDRLANYGTTILVTTNLGVLNNITLENELHSSFANKQSAHNDSDQADNPVFIHCLPIKTNFSGRVTSEGLNEIKELKNESYKNLVKSAQHGNRAALYILGIYNFEKALELHSKIQKEIVSNFTDTESLTDSNSDALALYNEANKSLQEAKDFLALSASLGFGGAINMIRANYSNPSENEENFHAIFLSLVYLLSWARIDHWDDIIPAIKKFVSINFGNDIWQEIENLTDHKLKSIAKNINNLANATNKEDFIRNMATNLKRITDEDNRFDANYWHNYWKENNFDTMEPSWIKCLKA